MYMDTYLSFRDFEKKFTTIPNGGQGDCFFLSLAYFMPNYTGDDLRKTLADYYRDNEGMIKREIFSKELGVLYPSIFKHGKKIRNKYEWADGQDIIFSARIFKKQINIYIKDEKKNRYMCSVMYPENSDIVSLLYSGGNHYEALQTKYRQPKNKYPLHITRKQSTEEYVNAEYVKYLEKEQRNAKYPLHSSAEIREMEKEIKQRKKIQTQKQKQKEKQIKEDYDIAMILQENEKNKKIRSDELRKSDEEERDRKRIQEEARDRKQIQEEARDRQQIQEDYEIARILQDNEDNKKKEFNSMETRDREMVKNLQIKEDYELAKKMEGLGTKHTRKKRVRVGVKAKTITRTRTKSGTKTKTTRKFRK